MPPAFDRITNFDHHELTAVILDAQGLLMLMGKFLIKTTRPQNIVHLHLNVSQPGHLYQNFDQSFMWPGHL